MEPQYLKPKDSMIHVLTKKYHHISSIYQFNFELRIADFRILCPKDTPIFDHANPITIKVTFSFLEYVLACKKSARFIHSLKLESHAYF